MLRVTAQDEVLQLNKYQAILNATPRPLKSARAQLRTEKNAKKKTIKGVPDLLKPWQTSNGFIC